MYKRQTKGGINEFNRALYARDSYLLQSREELNQLIDQKLIQYVFQPIVDARTGEIFAYEALMRPRTKNLKSPLDVLTLARSQSKLYEIERLTMFESMASYVRQKDSFGNARLFVNSIPNQILTEKDLALLEDVYGEDLRYVVVELTENDKMDERFTVRKLAFLKKWNGSLALDDFGTGYNGDGLLLSYTPAYVKIDMSIIRGIDQDQNRQLIFLSLIHI